MCRGYIASGQGIRDWGLELRVWGFKVWNFRVLGFQGLGLWLGVWGCFGLGFRIINGYSI